jgi:hypothetical protein
MSTTTVPSIAQAAADARAQGAAALDRYLQADAPTPGNDLVNITWQVTYDASINAATIVYNVEPKDPSNDVWLLVPAFVTPDLQTRYSSALFGVSSTAPIQSQGMGGVYQSQQWTPQQQGTQVTAVVSGDVTGNGTPFNVFQFTQTFTLQ